MTTLTKRMSEDLTDYLGGDRLHYLHSDVDTLRRVEPARSAKGDFDALVGINLLREGLDLPEVSLVAILDADKEGFLRSRHSLIQTIGRAARHVERRGHMYADRVISRWRGRSRDQPPAREADPLQRGTRHRAGQHRKQVRDLTDMLAREDEDTAELIGGGRQRSRGKAPVSRNGRSGVAGTSAGSS